MADILLERKNKELAVVTLNRPDRLNAMTRETVAEINGVLDGIAKDRECRAVIITGAGRGFCSGQDMAAVNQRNQKTSSGVVEKLYWQEQFAGIGKRMRSMPQLVVAGVNGPAVGAGMAIALAADVRIVSETAKFLVGAVRIGLTAGESGVSYILPRMIGSARAFDVMVTGRPILADEAVSLGIAVQCVAPDQLMEAASSYIETVLANSPYSIAQTKKLMWENLEASSFDAAISAENRAQILGTLTEDYHEASDAFINKRAPRFQGK